MTTVGDRQGKAKDTAKRVCRPGLTPAPQEAHVMKCCTCWTRQPMAFLASHSFCTVDMAYSLGFHSYHTADNHKLIEDIHQLKSPSASRALGLPQWLGGKESACNAGNTGNLGSIPGLGRSPGEENGNALQYSCLGNPKDRGDWQGLQSMWLQRVRHD